MTRLSAAGALGRGVANLRANRELVAVNVAGSVAVFALVALSVLPWLATLGLDLEALAGEPDPEKVLELLRGLGSPAEILARLGGLLLSFSVALTLTSILWCWYFGGILGVLVAGDAQAPRGPGREPALFRTYTFRFFAHEGRRLLWRLLAYVSLFLLFWTLVALLLLLAVAAAGLLGQENGVGAGCAVACGALLPILFVSFALMAAMSLGQVDLVRADSGVLAACAAGFRTLSHRLGAAALVLMLSLGATVAIALASTVLDVVRSLAFSGAASVVVKCLLLLVELVLGAVVSIGATAAFVALARDDAAQQARPETV